MTVSVAWGWARCRLRGAAVVGVLLAVSVVPSRAQPALPEAVAAPAGSRAVITLQAVGAQIHECAAEAGGGPRWRFREPVAALFRDGATVGRHFVGPSWQLADGSLVVARAAGSAPGATAEDIPLLRLGVAEGQASGQFAAVRVVQRVNTRGGVLTGPCEAVGALRAVPYSSDYVFLAPGG